MLIYLSFLFYFMFMFITIYAYVTLLHKYHRIMDFLTLHQHHKIFVHVSNKSIQGTLDNILAIQSLLGRFRLQVMAGTFHCQDLVFSNSCDLLAKNQILIIIKEIKLVLERILRRPEMMFLCMKALSVLSF